MKKPTLKQLSPLLIIVLAIVIFAVLKITQPSSTAPPIQERSWHIQTVIANPQTYSPTLTLYGQLETSAMVNAAAPKNSRVTSIKIREGDPIHKGQLLLSLDERDFKPRLQQAEARVTELNALIQSEKSRFSADKSAINDEKSILKLEQSAVERAQMLKNKKLGSTAALEQAQEDLKRQQLAITIRNLALDDHSARLQQLKARLTYAQADVELSQLDLERSQIIAPFAGFIEKLSVTAGDQVKENQILLTFYSTDQLEVRAKIPASFQNEIQTTLFNKQHLSATADYAGVTLQLTLNRLSGMADARGIDALFNINSGNEWVRPGSSISLSLKRPNQQNVIALPYSALYDNNRIYRVINNRLEKINIQVMGNYSDSTGEKVLISSSQLSPGDDIMLTHLPNAINGLKVKFSTLAL